MVKTSKKPRPVFERRMGAVKVVVWRNESENGAFFSSVFSRLYLRDGMWQETDGMRRDDLPLIEKLAAHTQEWIYATESREREQERLERKERDGHDSPASQEAGADAPF